jgi:hypothetical protein
MSTDFAEIDYLSSSVAHPDNAKSIELQNCAIIRQKLRKNWVNLDVCNSLLVI